MCLCAVEWGTPLDPRENFNLRWMEKERDYWNDMQRRKIKQSWNVLSNNNMYFSKALEGMKGKISPPSVWRRWANWKDCLLYVGLGNEGTDTKMGQSSMTASMEASDLLNRGVLWMIATSSREIFQSPFWLVQQNTINLITNKQEKHFHNLKFAELVSLTSCAWWGLLSSS